MNRKVTKVGFAALLILVGFGVGLSVQELPFVYDWENRHSPMPEKHVFQTQYLGGTQIVFDHALHAEDLELECIECHHVEGCSHCHRKDVTQIDVQESKVAIHKNCFACHEDMSCVECHDQ